MVGQTEECLSLRSSPPLANFQRHIFHYIAQDGLKRMILLSLSPEFWNGKLCHHSNL